MKLSWGLAGSNPAAISAAALFPAPSLSVVSICLAILVIPLEALYPQMWTFERELEGCEKKKKTEYRHRSWPLAVGPRVVFKCSFWAQVSGGEATDGFGCH